jgi:hypothetical protein
VGFAEELIGIGKMGKRLRNLVSRKSAAAASARRCIFYGRLLLVLFVQNDGSVNVIDDRRHLLLNEVSDLIRETQIMALRVFIYPPTQHLYLSSFCFLLNQ